MKRICLLLLAAAATTWAADTLDLFGRTWSVPNKADWEISQEGGIAVARLATHRGPLPGPRRPIQFALADVPDYGRLKVEADVMPLGRSVLLVFAYRDEAHFDYAHLSIDTGEQQPVHNGIFHVYGGDRVRISAERGPAAFAATGKWYHLELTHEPAAGTVRVLVDGKAVPALEAVDRSLGAGRAGFGSFDETGQFKNVRIAVSGP